MEVEHKLGVDIGPPYLSEVVNWFRQHNGGMPPEDPNLDPHAVATELLCAVLIYEAANVIGDTNTRVNLRRIAGAITSRGGKVLEL